MQECRIGSISHEKERKYEVVTKTKNKIQDGGEQGIMIIIVIIYNVILIVAFDINRRGLTVVHTCRNVERIIKNNRTKRKNGLFITRKLDQYGC